MEHSSNATSHAAAVMACLLLRPMKETPFPGECASPMLGGLAYVLAFSLLRQQALLHTCGLCHQTARQICSHSCSMS